MKILGLLFIVMCGSYAGVCATAVLRKNEAMCRMVRTFLDELAILMRCTCSALPELMEELCLRESFSELGFIKITCSELSKGTPFPKAWSIALKMDKHLTAELSQLLMDLGGGLGTSDIEGQLMNIERAVEQLRLIHEKALEKYRTKGRLYRCLGVLGGMSAALLLC